MMMRASGSLPPPRKSFAPHRKMSSAADSDGLDAAVPFSEVMAQITRVKLHHSRERPKRDDDDAPSWDKDLLGRAEPGSPQHAAEVGLPTPQRSSVPPPPPVRYNLKLDGSRPWLVGGYRPGREFIPVPGFLPQKDLHHWDQQRCAAPERSYTTGRSRVEVKAAQLYDRVRADAPDWKPTTWKHTGECFPLPEDGFSTGRRGAGSQQTTPTSRSLPALELMSALQPPQRRKHGHSSSMQLSGHSSTQLSRAASLPQVGTGARGYANLRPRYLS